MAEVIVHRRDAKTGNKRERTLRKLSSNEVAAGRWARGMSGQAHHFFIDGESVCGRPLPNAPKLSETARTLCPQCYAAVGYSISQNAVTG